MLTLYQNIITLLRKYFFLIHIVITLKVPVTYCDLDFTIREVDIVKL